MPPKVPKPLTPEQRALKTLLETAAGALDALAFHIAANAAAMPSVAGTDLADELDLCHEGWLRQAEWMRRAANDLGQDNP